MPRAAAGATLALLALLGLATTQPWLTGLVQDAPGSVRTRWAATGGALVPWASAAGLTAGAATLVLLARGAGTSGRVLGLLTALGSLAATAGALLAVTGRAAVPDGVLLAVPTAWSWVALVAGAAATVTASMALLTTVVRPAAVPPPGRAGRTAAPTPDPLPAERHRREEARVWAELDAGRDPTRGTGAGTMSPGAPAQASQVPPRTVAPVDPDGRDPHHPTDRPQTPDQEHPMEHENHYHSKAAWVGVTVMLVATVLGSWAAVFGPAWLLWGGLALFAVGALVWYAMSKAGYGAEAYEAPRPQESTGHRG